MDWERYFSDISLKLFAAIHKGEHLTLRLKGEQSLFTRVSSGKIRQITEVQDFDLSGEFICLNNRVQKFSLTLSANLQTDFQHALQILEKLRAQASGLPEDPFTILPENHGSSSRQSTKHAHISAEQMIHDVLAEVNGQRFFGLIVCGPIFRGHANSVGLRHWFETYSYFVDYSLISADEHAVKGLYSEADWDRVKFGQYLQESKTQLQSMQRPRRHISPGGYRAYLAPYALVEFLTILSWGGLSESGLQRGLSALLPLRRGEKSFSAQFSLKENFRTGLVPRFNDHGELAPEELPLIENGQLVNTLISSRTAKEYGLKANGAADWELPRSPEISRGKLKREHILPRLGTGVYVGNTHYLNYSDRSQGRVTGMTRYACFWVEKGEIVAPIKDMRFDDSFYRIFGQNLLEVTEFQELLVDTSTYERRQLGGALLPGILVEDFTFTI